ncbi:thiamine pyrophosphate-binding protein [Rhodoplanes sp. Z2-YC6860]|uniref:thiamine pyrophosphate-binding protein n=1 Tax=Rhodoplanes sp. Z2-YC6860 TaxID=674703 RepID=UPI00078D09AD|nr:thiamine pyrophosphate-binding protein [Rhodoplanes sp. Z2-YC6860]AMN39264.1 thiamine pyrophosphate enzyme-like TPP-binding protein [Rhodoplanes sp. Z2-YC6860]
MNVSVAKPPIATSVSKAPAQESVGDAIARALADMGVTTAFGVISIHNMPILDAIARQGRIRFVPARGEAGAMNMADAYARVSRSIGVCFTSTGTAAGNAAGSQVEALTAGSPVLHITTQVDREFVDRDRAAIHDVPRQPDMLKAISKSYLRIWEPAAAIETLLTAVRHALTAPTGPVTLEIPVDVQRTEIPSRTLSGVPAIPAVVPDGAQLDTLAQRVLKSRRPMLWLGGGARGAAAAAKALADRGFGIVTSTQGRAVVPESHGHSLGAFNMTPAAEAIYRQSDLMIVVGSRLRGNETKNNRMVLPPLVQIDAEPGQGARNYPVDMFINGDARLALEGLLSRLPARLDTDAAFLESFAAARRDGETALRAGLGPYGPLADELSRRVHDEARPWVRDVTISNSTFGNRYVRLAAPHLGVHALGGGIGQGIAMGIGAALAGVPAKTITLLGDGGSQLMIGELATAVESKANLVFVLMNDRGYGVIRNIQDAQYGGRHVYADILTPNFALVCQAVGLPHMLVRHIGDFSATLQRALDTPGPCLIEIDMVAIGPFSQSFAGPPAGAAGKPAS